jgi:uncharacterized protein YecE (DUF72 family)
VAKVYTGTSGWAYPSWKPDFYPAKLPSAKFLGFYAERLNSVEVNYTFRRFPTEKLLRGWIAATPPGFQFAVKANQKITHISRLKNVAAFTSDFLGALEPLATERKLGPVLFQLPPYLRADVALLKDFLASVPRNVRSAFEFRHPSWFSEDVYVALREANVTLCNAESEKLETPAVQTADFAYLRLRKQEYSDAEQQVIANTVSGLVKNGDAYVYFKHEETPDGAFNALKLLGVVKTA